MEMFLRNSILLFGLHFHFVLLVVRFQPSSSAPQGAPYQSSKPYPSFQGALSWNWESSGNGDTEEPKEAITTLTDSTGQQAWIQLSSETWGDHEEPLPESKRGRRCNYDGQCEKAQFCHEHYKYCENRKYDGQKCRRTENCLRGAICMWGECTKEKKPGQVMSRCKRHIDCSKNLCCARQHGESVCKKYLKEGETCSVSNGGYVYSFQHKCSCGFGLVCKNVAWTKKEGWNPKKVLKCVKMLKL